MDKGTRCRITVKRGILAGCPNKQPQRFPAGSMLYGAFETNTANGGACFRVDGVDDFVFFPPKSIEYEEVKETPQDLARRTVRLQKQLSMEDPRKWASKLAEDVADADD